jgi:ATP-dependent helicase/nuclease subunit A
VVEQLKAKLAWRYPFEAAVGEAAKTSVSALRRRAADEDEEARKIFDARIDRAAARTRLAADSSQLSATERGNVHHLFLQLLDLERAGSEAELKAEAQKCLHSGQMKVEQVEALDFAAISQFWQSDLGRRIRANAGCVRRELAFTARFSTGELAALTGKLDIGLSVTSRKPEPIQIPLTCPSDTLSPNGGEGRGEGARVAEQTVAPGSLEDFVLVQGVADLVVLLPNEIWLVDFKTDEVVSDEVEAKTKLYEPQLKLYALALERIYRRPVTECRLHFLSLPQAKRTAQSTEPYEQGELF